MDRTESKKTFDSLCQVMPGGVSSPGRAFKGLSLDPMVASKGKGALLTDVDGNEFIDYNLGWGAHILGHAHQSITQAIASEMKNGFAFGTSSKLELELASQMVEKTSVEKVRFVSTGTEALMAAMRLSRGYTKKPLIIKFNASFHKHGENFVRRGGESLLEMHPKAAIRALPEELISQTKSLPFNDLEAVKRVFHELCDSGQIAAVLMEVIPCNSGMIFPHEDFLHFLRQETRRCEALLVFDEVITGFRVSGFHGAQGLYGIKPDLCTYGLALGGGMPVAAIGGKKDLLDHFMPEGDVYQTGTLSGHSLCLAAAIAAIEEMNAPNFFFDLERNTKMLVDPVKEALKKKGIVATVSQQDSLFWIGFGIEQINRSEDLDRLDLERFNKFYRFLFERGVYLTPSPIETSFVSGAHTMEQIERTRDVMLEFIASI